MIAKQIIWLPLYILSLSSLSESAFYQSGPLTPFKSACEQQDWPLRVSVIIELHKGDAQWTDEGRGGGLEAELLFPRLLKSRPFSSVGNWENSGTIGRSRRCTLLWWRVIAFILLRFATRARPSLRLDSDVFWAKSSRVSGMSSQRRDVSVLLITCSTHSLLSGRAPIHHLFFTNKLYIFRLEDRQHCERLRLVARIRRAHQSCVHPSLHCLCGAFCFDFGSDAFSGALIYIEDQHTRVT